MGMQMQMQMHDKANPSKMYGVRVAPGTSIARDGYMVTVRGDGAGW